MMGEHIQRILIISAQGAALILALILIRRLAGKRIPARLTYALWLLPAIRLILPASFKSSLSIMAFIAKLGGSGTGAQTSAQPSYTAGLTEAAAHIDAAGIATPAPYAIAPELSSATEAAASAYGNAGGPGNAINGGEIAFIAWAVGAAAVLAYMIAVNASFYKRMRKNRKRFDCPCKTPVYIVNGLSSPCLCGYIRPYILINEAAMKNGEIMELVLRHELCHLKALDQWWVMLRNVCCALHWFNPLVWLAAFISRTDCELACDAAVMRGFDDEQRNAYGMALLSIIRPEQKKKVRTAAQA